MEILIGMVLGLIILGAAYQILVSQSRQYLLHRETIDARETLRGAAALLVFELRHASAARGDLAAIGAQTLTLRSVMGVAVVCADTVITSESRYGLWQPSGSFEQTANDSAMVYSATNQSRSTFEVHQVWTSPASAGLPSCEWPGAPAPQLAVEIDGGDTTGVRVGTQLRAFRTTQYGLFQQSGRWWLGARVGSSSTWEIVTGPLQTSGGLSFQYYDQSGAVTADPLQVARVGIVLRAESYGKARSPSGVAERRDSVSVVAFLRN